MNSYRKLMLAAYLLIQGMIAQAYGQAWGLPYPMRGVEKGLGASIVLGGQGGDTMEQGVVGARLSYGRNNLAYLLAVNYGESPTEAATRQFVRSYGGGITYVLGDPHNSGLVGESWVQAFVCGGISYSRLTGIYTREDVSCQEVKESIGAGIVSGSRDNGRITGFMLYLGPHFDIAQRFAGGYDGQTVGGPGLNMGLGYQWSSGPGLNLGIDLFRLGGTSKTSVELGFNVRIDGTTDDIQPK